MPGATLVLVTHDPEIANRADRKIVLKDGMIIEDTLPSADPAEVAGCTSERTKWLSVHWAGERASAIAWRDLKSAPGKFAFVVLSVAVGVAALVGVRGFSESFRTTLMTEARSLMAGDLSARIFHVPSADELKKIAALEQGIRGKRVDVGYGDGLDGVGAAGSGAVAGFAEGG